jgi:hypothetical protein
MEYLVPKAPGDTVRYFADWSKQLGGDCISTFTLTVTSGTVTLPEVPCLYDGEFIRFLVAGGADGEMAVLTCTVNTVGMQELTREIQLFVSDQSVSVTPSTVAKRALIEMAFEEIGLAGYEFDPTSEEYASALRRLDAIMAEWRTSSLDLGYNAPAVVGDSDLDDPSGIPDDAVRPVFLTLAFDVCPPLGKSMSVESKARYASSMDLLRTRYAPKIERRLPRTMPIGMGHRPWSTWWPYGMRFRR